MNRLTITDWLGLILLCVCLATTGCTMGYFKCRDCDTAYKLVGGLPHFRDPSLCRLCGGTLFPCSEVVSGWDEERYQRLGDESL